MSGIIVWITLIISCIELSHGELYATVNKDEFYTGAVVEFVSPPLQMANPKEHIESTLNEYLRLIDEAADNNVDIMVFPEGTLNYVGMNTRELLIKYAIELREFDIKNSTDFDNVCDYSKHSNLLAQLSSKIKERKLYVLVNLIEKVNCKNSPSECSSDGYFLYNTNLAFDRNGCVISRHRKFTLFMEPLVNITQVPDVAFFFTDFGVTFGHFVCFEIMFQYPANILVQHGVKHILYPTYWFNHLPFVIASQIQQGYAYSNNVVLLAAGGNFPMYGQAGSGIFIGKNGATGLIMPGEITQQLIISKVPKDVDSFSVHVPDNVVKKYSITQLDELFVNRLEIPDTYALPKQGYRKICHGKMCCEFDLDYRQLEIPPGKQGYNYRLTLFSGQARMKEEVPVKAGMMYCAVIACTGDRTETCGTRFKPSDNLVPSVQFDSIEIRATTEIVGSEADYFIMPSTVDFTLLPLNTDRFKFQMSSSYKLDDKTYKNISIEANDVNDILTFGFYGRIFNLDEIVAEVEDDESQYENILFAIAVGLLIFIILMKFC